ncbi:MAG: hypothetical protein PHE72_14830, partial [candidate division Zixibacteria bacterium]|nr:hypothetical protein [candidate division Zixibacteria bacterium]
GLGTGMVPGVFERMPGALQVFFADPLSSTTVLVIILYQLFHIGARKRIPSTTTGMKPVA